MWTNSIVKPDPDPHFFSCWIRIHIEQNSWILIRNKFMWIHSPTLYQHIFKN